MNECIEYISSHLYSFNDYDIISNFSNNGFEFCEKIIKSKEPKIENKDKLCLLLLDICRRNNIFFDLFGFSNLQFCSSKVYDELYKYSVENSSKSNLLTIYNETLKNHSNIRNKIEISNESITSFEKHFTHKQFQITNEFIYFVESWFAEKVSQEISIEMTASSVDGGNLSNINSYSNNDDFYTIIQPNPWLKADLKGYKLKPKSYILQSRCLSNSDFLRSWKLEGIKEDGTTIVLENNNYKFTQREIKEFPLQTNDYFVAFRITQTGKNSYGNERLMINIFDFKGELIKI